VTGYPRKGSTASINEAHEIAGSDMRHRMKELDRAVTPHGGDATVGLCSVRGSHGIDQDASPYIGTHICLPNGGILEAF
jgi:hypothetical protein